MTENEMKQHLKEMDSQIDALSAEMSSCWAKASESHQEEILLRVKTKKLSKTQKITFKSLLGLSGVLFASAIFVNPALLFGTVISLCCAGVINKIYSNAIEKNENKIKQYEENYHANKVKQEELFSQIEKLQVERFNLASKMQKLNACETEREGVLKPIKEQHSKFIKMRKGYER